LKKSDKKFDEKGGDQMKEIVKNEEESRDNESQGDDDGPKKQPVNDYKDSYEMSKLALKNCHQIEDIHERFVRAGEGKYVSNPKKNIKDAYKQIFNLPEPNIHPR